MNILNILPTITAVLLTLILSTLFPLSAIVYLIFQRQKKVYQLKEDLRLLGIFSEDNSQVATQAFSESQTLTLSFLSHSLLPMFLAIIGSILLLNPDAIVQDNARISALQFGFLGSYVFSIQLLYRRYTTFDLQPAVYLYCAITLIAGLAFNFTAAPFLADNLNKDGIEGGISAVVAFSLGYFPLLAIRWFNQAANSALGNKTERNNSLPLSIIDGVSQFHEVRLREEGIDNVQNLAAVKIDELLANTRFNAQQVLEWVDQAILHSYLHTGSWESFRRGGVRKITDFQEFWKPYYVEKIKISQNGQQKINQPPEELSDLRRNQALQLQSTPEQLDSLYLTTATGPNIAYIEAYWQNLKMAVQHRAADELDYSLSNVKTIINKAQNFIFREIAKLDLFNKDREKLGHIVKILSENRHNDIAVEKTSDCFRGLGWWYWWLAKADGNGQNAYRNLAKSQFELALNASDIQQLSLVNFEIALLYAELFRDLDSAIMHVGNSVELSRQNGSQLTLLQAMTMRSILQLASENKEAHLACLEEVFDLLKDLSTQNNLKEGLEKVRNVLLAAQTWFDDPPPPELNEALEKIDSMREKLNLGGPG